MSQDQECNDYIPAIIRPAHFPPHPTCKKVMDKGIIHVRPVGPEVMAQLYSETDSFDGSMLDRYRQAGCDAERFWESLELFDTPDGSQLVLIACDHEVLTD
jgi:hypothetical protein